MGKKEAVALNIYCFEEIGYLYPYESAGRFTKTLCACQ